MISNFSFLLEAQPELAGLGAAAENYLYQDPNAAIYKLGLLGEKLAGLLTEAEQVALPPEAGQADKLMVLERGGVLPSRIADFFHALRRARNQAVHHGEGDTEKAKAMLQMAYHLMAWYAGVYEADAPQPAAFRVPTQEEALESALAKLPRSPIIMPQEHALSLSERRQLANQAVSALQFTAEEQHYLEKNRIGIGLSVSPVISFSMQQNGMPLLRELTLTNQGSQDIENVLISLTVNPSFGQKTQATIGLLPAGESVTIPDLQLRLDGDYLAGLTEKVAGYIQAVAYCGGTEMGAETADVIALPPDQWAGCDVAPEMLAAFATPMHSGIAAILSCAGRNLNRRTGNASFDAYASGSPQRVMQQTAAIGAAIEEMKIHHAFSAVPLQQVGQKIRLYDELKACGMGNTLGVTMLFVSCLEAAGLNPLLILQQEGVLAGVWLQDKGFSQPVLEEAAPLVHRLNGAEREIALFDCAALLSGLQAGNIRDDLALFPDQNQFICAIDLRQARGAGISPLAQRKQAEALPAPAQPLAPFRQQANHEPAPAAFSRWAHWEKKLLDISLRNGLISLKAGSSVLPLFVSSTEALLTALNQGMEYMLQPRMDGWKEEEDKSFFEAVCGQAVPPVAEVDFQNGHLHSPLSKEEQEKKLKGILRGAKTAMEEGGVSTLYLAFGLLRWHEKPGDQAPRYAPLILYPAELQRKGRAYVLRSRGEEPMLNVTLMEKLRQEFALDVSSLEGMLSRDGKMQGVLEALGQAVSVLEDWAVLDGACLGLFAFSRFLMWSDLHNHGDALRENPLIQSLLEGKLCWPAKKLEMPARVECSRPLPLVADASQMFAIEAACTGQSFVLHGPPGTGKSQTITNILANAIGDGKRVLFVSAKQAALQVVHKRLQDMGLNPFCLELYSNQARKQTMLAHLQHTMDLSKGAAASDYARQAGELAQIRQRLEAYANDLYTPGCCGLSLYEWINLHEKNKHAPDYPCLSEKEIKQAEGISLDQQRKAVEKLLAAAETVGSPARHPLAGVGRVAYSQQMRQALPGLLSDYLAALDGLIRVVAEITVRLDLPLPNTPEEIENLHQLCGRLSLWTVLPKAWAEAEDAGVYLSHVLHMAENQKKISELGQRLLKYWEEGFLHEPAQDWIEQWKDAMNKGVLTKKRAQSALLEQAAVHSKRPEKLTMPFLHTQLSQLEGYQKARARAEEESGSYKAELGKLDKGMDTDWDAIRRYAIGAYENVLQIEKLGYDGAVRGLAHQMGAALNGMIAQLQHEYTDFCRAQTALFACVELPPAEGKAYFSQQRALAQAVGAHVDQLGQWAVWQEAEGQAEEAGMGYLVKGFYCPELRPHEILPAYEKALSAAIAEKMIQASSALNQFNGVAFEMILKEYQRLDQQLTGTARQEIFCRAVSRLPDATQEAAWNKEISTLLHHIGSKGRGVSIRDLFQSLPTLLPRLCPCVLMSPLSAAKYLEARNGLFDLVVIDEASQLPTSEAVGVLARARNAVIVGDPLQMPPTSFFTVSVEDEEHLDEADLESVLEDCLSLSMPQAYLRFHYRSRHESLIAFSNDHFYENRLFTFPSADDRVSRVHLRMIKGCYDRSGTRENRAEAEAIVEEVRRRCHDPYCRDQSLGVVTFNIMQQNLIDDLIQAACQQDAALEKWLFDREEALFIKNLENVQGDERDVILFSIGYGPDQEGRVSNHFGPLNKAGGWRRLNVAITRARQEMMVFSTLSPEQISLSRTSAEGVIALRRFLEYAGGRALAMKADALARQQEKEAGIIRAICDELTAAGYRCTTGVGRSGCRVDVAVQDPHNEDRYSLGILLDGESYAHTYCTRDRELALPDILKGLGWTLLRVRCMDWWENRDQVMQKIIEKLQALHGDPSGSAGTPPDAVQRVALLNG